MAIYDCNICNATCDMVFILNDLQVCKKCVDLIIDVGLEENL